MSNFEILARIRLAYRKEYAATGSVCRALCAANRVAFEYATSNGEAVALRRQALRRYHYEVSDIQEC